MTNRTTSPNDGGIVFDTHGLAEYFNNSESFWEKRRISGDGPTYFKLGKKVIYRLTDVEEWLATKAHRSTSEPEHAA